jgi:hypothetical protein
LQPEQEGFRQIEQDHHDWSRRACKVRYPLVRASRRAVPSPSHRAREHQSREEEAKSDRQRQANEQQPRRNPDVAPANAEVRIGSVGEQNDGAREFHHP